MSLLQSSSDDIVLAWTQECMNIYKRSGMDSPPAHEIDVMRNIFGISAKQHGRALLPHMMLMYKELFLENNRPVLIVGFDPMITMFALSTNVHIPVDILELPTYQLSPEINNVEELKKLATMSESNAISETKDKLIANIFGKFTPQRQALFNYLKKLFPINIIDKVNFNNYGLIYIAGTYFFKQNGVEIFEKLLHGITQIKATSTTKIIFTGIENPDIYNIVKSWENSEMFNNSGWRRDKFRLQIMVEPGQYLYTNYVAQLETTSNVKSEIYKYVRTRSDEILVPKRTMMITLAAGKNYRDEVRPGINTKIEYCNINKYNFLLGGDEFVDRSRPIAWSKIKMIEYVIKNIKDLCEDSAADIPEWLFVSDADVVITNPTIQLDKIIEKYESVKSTVWLVLVKDLYGNINNGNMWIRVCNRSLEFLYEVWAQTQFIHHRWWENAAMIHVIQKPEWSNGVILEINDRLFNSYVDIGSTTPLTPEQKARTWQPGDFLVHLAGKYQSLRKMMERILSDNLSGFVMKNHVIPEMVKESDSGIEKEN